VEFDRTENPLRDELVKPKFELENGRLMVPNQPGLGIDIDEDKLRQYLDK
jgi:D-galactarolactone cycloisomerase